MSVNRSIILGALALPALIGCGSSGVEATVPSSGNDSPSPTPPPPAVATVHGRYVGAVQIDGVEYFADALFTPGGEARIFFDFGRTDGGSSAVIPGTRSDAASQFVGHLELDQEQAAGSGLIIGEGCAISAQARFCNEAAAAELRFPGASAGFASELEGSISVMTAQGIEVWALTLSPWNNVYPFGIELQYAAGQYREQIAEFVADEDTLIVIDDTGRLFFQSAGSGCTGNGSVMPDADFNLLQVTLTIESCHATFSYLIGDYSGLGTFSTSDYWSYDSMLRMWLSKPGSASPRAAITMWGDPY